jgi:glycosyltransferase involved in cell wall biosynthesis
LVGLAEDKILVSNANEGSTAGMNSQQPLKIVYLTAGAAGMYCGSCMHDNTLARALMSLGCDVQLIPLYTPIRTDEPSATSDQVFFGGINVYLQQRYSFFRYVPRWLDRWLDQSWLLRWASSGGVKTKASELGDLAISIIKGEAGHQKKEIERLMAWLASNGKPDVVVFTNLLVAGCISAIKRRWDIPVLVTLQGDDIFLNDLPDTHKSQAFAELSKTIQKVDGFILHSRYYADFMNAYLAIPHEKMHIVPLGIDWKDLATAEVSAAIRDPTIGYLARLAPEKGLHVLVDAFIHLHRTQQLPKVRLRVAGWLGAVNQEYAETQFQKIKAAGLADYFEYLGEVDRTGKIRFLQSIDLLSVPTTYQEPKGLYVLEALAMGVPVVLPAHGAFPELVTATAGGVLVPPNDAVALAQAIAELLQDRERMRGLSQAGRNAIQSHFNAQRMAQNTLETLQNVIVKHGATTTTQNSD